MRFNSESQSGSGMMSNGPMSPTGNGGGPMSPGGQGGMNGGQGQGGMNGGGAPKSLKEINPKQIYGKASGQDRT